VRRFGAEKRRWAGPQPYGKADTSGRGRDPRCADTGERGVASVSALRGSAHHRLIAGSGSARRTLRCDEEAAPRAAHRSKVKIDATDRTRLTRSATAGVASAPICPQHRQRDGSATPPSSIFDKMDFELGRVADQALQTSFRSSKLQGVGCIHV